MSNEHERYYVIPSRFYLLDGTEVETVRYDEEGVTYWRYFGKKAECSGTLGVNLFIKNPCVQKQAPVSGIYVRPGYKVELFNVHTKEIGTYTMVNKLGDTCHVPIGAPLNGRYYGEVLVNSKFGQELLYLQKNDFAVYYLSDGTFKYYRVENISSVLGLYGNTKFECTSNFVLKRKSSKKKKSEIKSEQNAKPKYKPKSIRTWNSFTNGNLHEDLGKYTTKRPAIRTEILPADADFIVLPSYTGSKYAGRHQSGRGTINKKKKNR